MTLAALPIASPGLLTALIALPIIGAVLLSLFRADQEKQVKTTAIFFSVIVFIASLFLLAAPEQGVQVSADGTVHSYAAFEHQIIVSSPEITWTVGIDGLSIWLVLLSTFLTPLILAGSYKTIKHRVREYFAAFLILEAAMIGSLVALDLVVFYVFFELILIPMYLIIGIWGHERRIFAAVKFFLYTVVGSLFLFVAIGACYFAMPEAHRSFNLLAMYEYLNLPGGAQLWIFAAFALAMGIKVPLFPFHTWLPDAHVEAPTGGSVILAGVLLKVGTYGFVRFALPLFPYAAHEFAVPIMVLAVIGVVFAAFMAWVQDDMKKLVAYSSVSHLGFAMLGLFAMVFIASPVAVDPGNVLIGLQAAIFVMISHGLVAAALFFLVGVLYERRHTRLIDEYGGIAKHMPIYAVCALIAVLGSAGLPGTSGFIGEFGSMLGAYNIGDGKQWFAVVAGLGVIFGAVYILQMYRRVFFGPVTNPVNATMPDLTGTERLTIYPLLGFVILFGIFPNILLDRINPTTERIASLYADRMESFYDEYNVIDAETGEQMLSDDSLAALRANVQKVHAMAPDAPALLISAPATEAPDVEADPAGDAEEAATDADTEEMPQTQPSDEPISDEPEDDADSEEDAAGDE